MTERAKMFIINFVILISVILFGVGRSQRSVDDVCTIKSTGEEGTCKLISNCPSALSNLQQNNIIPETCGFQGVDPIVCCKKDLPPARKPGEISKEKCREYSKYIIERIKPPVLLATTSYIEKNECGHKVVKLIIGGRPAERKEFPHMVTIGYELTPGDIKWLCGGTIISEQYILTAAHCLVSKDFGPAQYVQMGVTDLRDKSKQKRQYTISERIPHPDYRVNSHYNDIALLKLSEPAKLNSFARPACLYTFTDITAEMAIATGWGNTAYAGISSEQLLKVTLDFFDHDTCNRSYRNQINRRLKQGILPDTQICAGSKTDEEKDTCQGDSGGPLQIYHITDDVKCMYDIVGVTSFGKACTGSPGVYTRVSYYVKWIEDTVWPQTS